MHSCQPALAASVVSGTGSACSKTIPAPGRTRSGSTRSIELSNQLLGLLAGSAGAVFRTPVLHSYPNFIINFIA
jgi:hypothetical protein